MKSEAQAQRRKEVVRRLRIIGGQLRAIERMVEAGEDCQAIATQLAASLQALKAATQIVLRNYMDDCLDPAAPGYDQQEAFDRFSELVFKFIR